MSLFRDGEAETAAPEHIRDQDLGRPSRGAVGRGAEARFPVDAHPAGEVRGGWSAVLGTGRRGGHPVMRRSFAQLGAAAGNTAVTSLLGTRESDARGARRVGPTLHHAADADVLGSEVAGAAQPGSSEPAPLGEGGQASAPPAPTTSFTKVGPPTKGSYTVSGSLRQAAEAVGARKEAGATLTTPDLVAAENGTRMTQAQVTVTQVVELPEWDGKASATQNQRAEWDRFKAAITAHEAGHVAVDVKAFAGAHTKILAKKTTAESNTEFDTITGQADTANATFDTSTDHGRNAGTKINPNIDEVTKVP